MSNTIPIEQASSHLTGLVRGLGPGDEIILTDNDVPVARIVPHSPPRVPARGAVATESLAELSAPIIAEARSNGEASPVSPAAAMQSGFDAAMIEKYRKQGFNADFRGP